MNHERVEVAPHAERQTPRILRLLFWGIFLCACGLFWRTMFLSGFMNRWWVDLVAAYQNIFWL